MKFADHYYDPLHLVEDLGGNIGWAGNVGSCIAVNDALMTRFVDVIQHQRALAAKPSAQDKLAEALTLLNELSLLWHGDAVAHCSNGKAVTGLKFDLLMERVEMFTFPYRKPA